ncbi:bcl-2-like protein 10 [Bombina bombina]|uniref:bcl-2-like protein 10 n=1 Tax=Bombina bombina TaxID=8345 RepID=UPI00235A9E9C|nr:bcl-2-like protein 10 [Bombina bombina]
MSDHIKQETSELLENYLQHCLCGVCAGEQQALSPAARTLRRVAGEMLSSNHSFFESCEKIHGDPREILKSVAAQLPENGGLNWGRVVSLIVFAGILTQKKRDHNAGTPKELAEVLSYFLTEEHRDWLQSNGGWDGFHKHFNKTGVRQQQESNTVSNALMAAAGFGLAGLAFLMAVR